MIPNLPVIDFLNNATERNKKRIEEEANLNFNSNSPLPSFSLPTSNFSTQYPLGVYGFDTNVSIEKRKRGRPATKKSKPSTRNINKALNDQTVINFINDLLQGGDILSLCTKYGVSHSTGYKLRSDYFANREYPFRALRGGARVRV